MEDKFLNTVPRALTYLYKAGQSGHWVDVRTTSEVVLALLAAGESMQSQHLHCAGDFLASSFKPEVEGGSWGSELWDTALGIRALNRLPTKDPEQIHNAFQWIWTKQFPDGSLDGEPWDSLFVSLVALETDQAHRAQKTIEWLLSLQTLSGALISRHYTGLFCQVLGLARNSGLSSMLNHKLEEAGIRALQYLWDEFDPKTLWGESSWTNAYILRGFLNLKHHRILARYDDIIAWYAAKQSKDGVWEDTVRTAIVTEALCALRLEYDIYRCNQKPLQALTIDFFSQSTQAELQRSIQLRTTKAPVVLHRNFIDRDESGNRVITLTQEREVYLAVGLSALGLLWGLVQNWNFIRGFIFP